MSHQKFRVNELVLPIDLDRLGINIQIAFMQGTDPDDVVLRITNCTYNYSVKEFVYTCKAYRSFHTAAHSLEEGYIAVDLYQEKNLRGLYDPTKPKYKRRKLC